MRRPVQMHDHEQIEQRDHEDDERHHEAEEHEGDQRRLAAIAGAGQLFLAVLAFQHVAQLEAVQRRFHVGGGLDAQARRAWR